MWVCQFQSEMSPVTGLTINGICSKYELIGCKFDCFELEMYMSLSSQMYNNKAGNLTGAQYKQIKQRSERLIVYVEKTMLRICVT